MFKNVLSDELVNQIDDFGNLVTEWNKLSLVANSTLNDLWGWHFLESLSIVSLLSENTDLKLYDFGGGGGVIGYPLFLYGFDINFVERSSNKMFFFKNILKYEKVFEFIEDYSDSLVIVRGVSSVLELLKILNNVSKLILFKSFSVKYEVKEALFFFDFKYEVFERAGNARGYIVYITDIAKKV